MGPEPLSKFLPVNWWSIVWASILIELPPLLSRSLQLARGIQHFLKVAALGYVQLLLYHLQPIIGLKCIRGMGEHRGTSFQELRTLVADLERRWCCYRFIVHEIHHSLH